MTAEQLNTLTATEAETAVLGACLLESDAYERAASILRPEMFYMSWHGLVFEIMEGLAATGTAIDILTVISAVKARGLQNPTPFEITGLTNSVVSSVHLQHHAAAVRVAWQRRELQRLGAEMMGMANDASIDPIELAGKVEGQLSDLVARTDNNEPVAAETVAVEVLQRQQALRDREHTLIGPSSGFRELDTETLGWQAPDLIILAARPAVGKTAFALQLATAAAFDMYNPTPTAVFTLEMSNQQLISRILSRESGVPMGALKAARLNDEQLNAIWERGVRKLAGRGLYLDDTSAISVSAMKAKLRRLKKKGVGLAIVDYLQLMTPPSSTLRGTRNDQVSAISRELKKCAKELNLPIIALSQLSRDVEKRGGSQKPRMSDLRDAGGIEQDADSIFFLYGHSAEDIKRNPDLKQQVALSVAKHRNGQLFDLSFHFDGALQKFTFAGHGELPVLPPGYLPISPLNDSPF